MADSLFKKLPDIWKDLDLRVSEVILKDECPACGHSIPKDYFSNKCPICHKFIGGRGLLERFLLTPDAGVRKIEDLIVEFLRSHNIEKTRERFVSLFNDLTGHRWKDNKSYQWNRNRSEVAITRASYKTTKQCIEDLAREHGATYCKVVDMASKVIVESKQGNYCEDDCWYFNSDYYHPGVFQLWASDNLDLVSFEDDFQYLKPAGTKWYYRIMLDAGDCSHESAIIEDTIRILGDAGYYSTDTLFFDEYHGFYEFYDWVPELAAEPSIGDIVIPDVDPDVIEIPRILGDAGYYSTDTLFFDEYHGFYEFYDWVPELAAEPEVGN